MSILSFLSLLQTSSFGELLCVNGQGLQAIATVTNARRSTSLLAIVASSKAFTDFCSDSGPRCYIIDSSNKTVYDCSWLLKSYITIDFLHHSIWQNRILYMYCILNNTIKRGCLRSYYRIITTSEASQQTALNVFFALIQRLSYNVKIRSFSMLTSVKIRQALSGKRWYKPMLGFCDAKRQWKGSLHTGVTI